MVPEVRAPVPRSAGSLTDLRCRALPAPSLSGPLSRRATLSARRDARRDPFSLSRALSRERIARERRRGRNRSVTKPAKDRSWSRGRGREGPRPREPAASSFAETHEIYARLFAFLPIAPLGVIRPASSPQVSGSDLSTASPGREGSLFRGSTCSSPAPSSRYARRRDIYAPTACEINSGNVSLIVVSLNSGANGRRPKRESRLRFVVSSSIRVCKSGRCKITREARIRKTKVNRSALGAIPLIIVCISFIARGRVHFRSARSLEKSIDVATACAHNSRDSVAELASSIVIKRAS